jgi:hypothetical protein
VAIFHRASTKRMALLPTDRLKTVSLALFRFAPRLCRKNGVPLMPNPESLDRASHDLKPLP